MSKRSTIAVLAGLLAAALFPAGCRDAVSPERGGPVAAQFAATASGIVLDQENGTLNESGTELIKGFNPTNPHLGDAIVATFFWLGSVNIIESVTDVRTTTPFTPVGNKYTLVEYITSGGISMATYVATNVQNFPDPNPDPGDVLAVRAHLSQSVTDGGVAISAWTGVAHTFSLALGAQSSASGAGSAPTIADPGAITVGAGALAYAVTMSNALVGFGRPAGFTQIGQGSDAFIVEDAEYLVQASAGSVDPQWTWFFDQDPRGGTWLGTVLALNPAPVEPPPATHLVFTVPPTNTTAGGTVSPAVQVAAQDDAGNTVAGFSADITIALGNNPGGGTLSGTKTVTPVNGVATFSNLSIDKAGNGYTLVATATGLNSATSALFNITAPPQVRAQASGGGRIDPGIGKTTFGFNVDSRSGPPFQGEMEVVYHGGTSQMTRIHSLVIDGLTSAPDPRGGTCITWSGSARINNSDQRRFTATACDNGEPGSRSGKGPDRFGLTVDGSVSTGLVDLTGGNTRARQ